MGIINFNDMLTKADKIETLNVFEEIISFIKDIKPSLDTINHSIQENVKKMPQATKKISKVTEATEVATTEILNVLDSVFPKIDDISNNINKQCDLSKDDNQNMLHILMSFQNAINANIDLKTLLPDIESAVKRLENSNNYDNMLLDTNTKLQSITDDATSIMMSLQVQDITSQQLAAVKHLLDSIQGRLSGILDKFETSEIQTLIGKTTNEGFSQENNETDLHRRIAFDPNAVDAFDKSLNRQDMVDDLFEKHRSGEDIDLVENISEQLEADATSENENQESTQENIVPVDINEEISQNDIDAMFGNQTEEVSNEPVNQNDIDAMFDISAIDAVDNDEPVSQDDIDKLFGA